MNDQATGTSVPVTLETKLAQVVEAHPGVLEVLEEFGIRIDPWTLIALSSSLAQLAEYSAIRHPGELAAAVAAFVAEDQESERGP